MGGRRKRRVWSEAGKTLGEGPCAGRLFVFRGRRGDLVKVIGWDGRGSWSPSSLDPMALQWPLSKRLESGERVWPSATEGKIATSPARLARLLEGLDGRGRPARGGRSRRDDLLPAPGRGSPRGLSRA